MTPKSQLEALGIRLFVKGEKLLACRPYGKLSDSDQQFIRKHRDELYENVKNQAETAKEISTILSGLYRKITPDEWQHLADCHPGWMQKRNTLENELDGHFLNNNPAAGQKVFFQLVDHLRNAPTIPFEQEQQK